MNMRLHFGGLGSPVSPDKGYIPQAEVSNPFPKRILLGCTVSAFCFLFAQGASALGHDATTSKMFQTPAADTVITGTVTNQQGEPLMGVSVTVGGTRRAYITDPRGQYSIKAGSGATLNFSYVGYLSQSIDVKGQRLINVTLVNSTQTSLEDVVVTALGVSKVRRGLGYAVQEVKGREFTEGRMNNIGSALTGKIAGVDATQANSGAGGSSRVVIRGNTSLNGNQQPLYVVDGMPIDNQNKGPVTSSVALNVDRGDGISNFNPDDIASISILKGGAAAALYGSQAANGVVLITTKKGSAQKGVG
ncbi:MAG: TonB-dependent receptor plug domain-containing protein, partial [bacterium]